MFGPVAVTQVCSSVLAPVAFPVPISNLHWLMCCAVINHMYAMVWVWDKLSQEVWLATLDTLESTGWDSQLKLLLHSRASRQMMPLEPSRSPWYPYTDFALIQSQAPPSVYQNNILYLPDLLKTIQTSPRADRIRPTLSHTLQAIP